MPDRRSRLGRGAAGVLTASALLLAPACIAMPLERTGASRPWRPPSTENVVAHHDQARNEAVAGRDLELIADVESGALLAVSRARIRIQRLSDPDGSHKPPPVTHEDPELFVPEFDGYPLWFVGRSTVESGSGEPRMAYGVTQMPNAGSRWRRALEVTADEGVELPEIKTGEAGAAVPINPDLNAGLVRPADAVPRAYSGWIDNGLDALHAGAFEDSPRTVEILEGFDQEQQEADGNGWKLRRSVVPKTHWSLATEGDGALVLFTLQETVQTVVGQGPAIELPEDGEIRAYSGKEQARKSVTATYFWQVGAYVPQQGENRGLVRVLGFSRDIASATVS